RRKRSPDRERRGPEALQRFAGATARGVRQRGGRRVEESEQPGDRLLELGPVHDAVDHALLEEELGPLESLRELLVDRLLDDARSREPDERLRLGEYHVPHRREAGRDAAGRRVRHDRDVGNARVREPGQERVRLGHLHEREDSLEHARPAGGGEDDERSPRLDRKEDGARDALSRGRGEASPEKREVHDREHAGVLFDPPLAADDGFGEAGLLARALQPVAVALRVLELERIGGDDLGEALDERPLIDQDRDVGARGDAEVTGALAAGPEIALELLVIQDLAAILALRPQPVGKLPPALLGFEPLLRLPEPGHRYPPRRLRSITIASSTGFR